VFVKQISKKQLIVGTPAKVNLFLEVLRRREDGYHDINSLFQAVSLFDRLEFRREEGRSIRIELKQPVDIPLDDSNLISRAFHLMQKQYAIQYGLAVRLEKNIPVAAGLGGGSSDAAATILACNILFELGLSHREMATLSLNVGSDVPFFFSNGQAIVTGRGEKIHETEFPRDYWLILITPRLAISTADTYARLNLGLTESRGRFNLDGCQSVDEFISTLRLRGNDLERVHFSSLPELARTKQYLLECGALVARMSGSGPTVFGVYREAPDVERSSFWPPGDWQVNIVRPISLGSQYSM